MELRGTSFKILLRINFILFVLTEVVVPTTICGNIIHFFNSANFYCYHEKNHHLTDIIWLALNKISICKTFPLKVKVVSNKETET
jgi:hypothetical protein